MGTCLKLCQGNGCSGGMRQATAALHAPAVDAAGGGGARARSVGLAPVQANVLVVPPCPRCRPPTCSLICASSPWGTRSRGGGGHPPLPLRLQLHLAAREVENCSGTKLLHVVLSYTSAAASAELSVPRDFCLLSIKYGCPPLAATRRGMRWHRSPRQGDSRTDSTHQLAATAALSPTAAKQQAMSACMWPSLLMREECPKTSPD